MERKGFFICMDCHKTFDDFEVKELFDPEFEGFDDIEVCPHCGSWHFEVTVRVENRATPENYYEDYDV